MWELNLRLPMHRDTTNMFFPNVSYTNILIPPVLHAFHQHSTYTFDLQPCPCPMHMHLCSAVLDMQHDLRLFGLRDMGQLKLYGTISMSVCRRLSVPYNVSVETRTTIPAPLSHLFCLSA